MSASYLPYVHIFLFRCKSCKRPLPVAVTTEARNHEKIDGDFFEIQCGCGWKKQCLGVEAVKHWVTDWETVKSIDNLSEAEEDQNLKTQ